MASDETNAARKFAGELTQLQRPLFVYIIGMVPQPADAEDVLQETNRVIWERYEDFQPGTNFAAWAYRIAYFEVLTWRKRRSRRAAQLSDETLALLAADEETAAKGESARCEALRSCLAGLPDEDRALLQKHYAEERPVDSIAQDMGRRANSVYRSLDRIRVRLMLCIQHRIKLDGLS